MKRQRYPTRKIRLVGPVQLMTLQTVLQGVPIDNERPIVVTIAEEVKLRKSAQNALMWAGSVKNISEQIYSEGRTFSEDVWHILFKRKYLPEKADPELTTDDYIKWDIDPEGELVLVGSTKQLTVYGFSQYLEQIYAYGANRGVEFTEARQ